MNTVSLYRDGQRLADPQMLPESLQGKARSFATPGPETL